jgi:hypothetical protein
LAAKLIETARQNGTRWCINYLQLKNNFYFY